MVNMYGYDDILMRMRNEDGDIDDEYEYDDDEIDDADQTRLHIDISKVGVEYTVEWNCTWKSHHSIV